MRTFIVAICLCVAPFVTIFSQDALEKTLPKWSKYLHLEAGFLYPGGTIKESISVRQNISSYYVDQYSSGYVSSYTDAFFVSARWEHFYNKFKTGISIGLRYTGYKGEITGYSSMSANFFYLRYSMQDSDTKFARVKSINESNSFVSIPIEIRVVPFNYKDLGFFAKAGSDIGILNLKQTTTISFQESSMKQYHDDIVANITNETNPFYSTLYTSVGMQYGKVNKPRYVFEVQLPSLFLSNNNFALTNLDTFSGIVFSIQIPIN